MKNRTLVLSAGLIITLLISLFSCKKINEATKLGDDLLPAIDNVTTFQSFLEVQTDNKPMNDTTRMQYYDYAAVGHINDPAFGTTDANLYFNISYPNPGVYPFVNKDSVIAVDSVVLSLSYQNAYGDTNSVQTVSVYEISQSSGFRDDSLYKFTDADFPTASLLGSKTFQVRSLADTILHGLKQDTTKMANVLRVRLNGSLATRFLSYTTTYGPLGAYYNDTARGNVGDSILKTLFRGFAIKTNGTGNALTYFKLSDLTKSKLTFYFQYWNGGKKDTSVVNFYHTTDGQADIVTRTPANGYATFLTNATPLDSLIYLQSTPGSYVSLRIPALDTFQNAVVHRAELIFTRLPDANAGTFTPPGALFLDRINNANDTAYTFDLDYGLSVGLTSSTYNVSSFGGGLKSDNTYHFNITRYVQKILTNKKPNNILRLYAPLRANLYSEAYGAKISPISVIGEVAKGRIILAGGNFSNPNVRARLRIVYSKLF